MINNYKAVLRKYVVFSGRATRSEYWYFVLLNFLISIAISIVGSILADGLGNTLQSLYSLAVLLPSLAVMVRRLHDTSHSAWWILINLIPLVGTIIFIVFLATDTVPAENKYGPSPKAVKTV